MTDEQPDAPAPDAEKPKRSETLADYMVGERRPETFDLPVSRRTIHNVLHKRRNIT